MWSGGSISENEVIELAESMLPAHQQFDEDLYAEMLALANAVGITPAEAVMLRFSDFVDAAESDDSGETPGELQEDDCTAASTPTSSSMGRDFPRLGYARLSN